MRQSRLCAAWNVWRAGKADPSTLRSVQEARLTDLVAFARTRSPFYRRLYRHLPAHVANLRDLPPVTKPALMENFDDRVTDPAITRAGVDAFVADKSLVGQSYLGRYTLWTTSGTTGTPGVFLHDEWARSVYGTLVMLRPQPGWLDWRRLWAFLHRPFRLAFVVTTGSHSAGVAACEQIRRQSPLPAHMVRAFSVLAPLSELVAALNDFQPAILVSYPSALFLLAHEQIAGRLRIQPLIVVSISELLEPAMCDAIEAAFGCQLHDMYGASEMPCIAFDCRAGWLHVNVDWLILEPVDDDYRPVPPGQASQTVLLTNLVNRVQPLIRYDLGDSVTLRPDPCPCGNPLPAIRVEGRQNDILTFHTAGGQVTRLPPLALSAVLEVPNVRRYQVVQTAPTTLSVRLEVMPGADEAEAWALIAGRLRRYLAAQGSSCVTVERSAEPPRRDPVSGKFRQVWSTGKHQAGVSCKKQPQI